MKALFHVDELEKWGLVLANVKNMIKYCHTSGVQCEIEVLANAVAVKEMKARDSQNGDTISRLSEEHVDFVACKNALNANGIEEKDMFPFVRTVPAGVVELVRKQGEGWAYIRP